MQLQIFQIDAFTSKLFGGNPAAVVPLKEWLPATTMQAIAAENNVSETAFFVPVGDGFEIRWFAPALEIDLCGHATLATAHILLTELGYTKNRIKFNTIKAGALEVVAHNGLYTLDFPARPAEKATQIPGDLMEALGNFKPLEILKARDYLFVAESEAVVKQLKPDFYILSRLDCGVVITAKGDDCDFVSRVFIPSAGVNEDPVTGSTHCNLIPYWATKLGKNKLHALQISERKGELFCELNGDRVLMSGKAITYLKGNIWI